VAYDLTAPRREEKWTLKQVQGDEGGCGVKRLILPWPLLLVWLIIAALMFYVGAAFGASWTAFTIGPSPIEDPISFLIWLVGLCVVLAPAVLIALRLLIHLFRRENNAPNR
jgi:hypothetical protein